MPILHTSTGTFVTYHMVRSMELSWILLFITAWHHIIGIGAMYPDKKMQYGPGSFGDDTPQFLLFTYSGNLTMKVSVLMYKALCTGCRKRSKTLLSRHLSKLTACLLWWQVTTLAGLFSFAVNSS